jgi:hypothetical protein
MERARVVREPWEGYTTPNRAVPRKSKRPAVIAGRLGYREERYVFFVCVR